MDHLTTGDIIPGERIGIFHLGMTWQALQGFLPTTYEREQRHSCFVIKIPTLWFFLDESSQLLTQVIAHGDFQGAFMSQIHVGSTLEAIEAVCGQHCRLNEDLGWELSSYPGISFYRQSEKHGIAYIAVHAEDAE